MYVLLNMLLNMLQVLFDFKHFNNSFFTVKSYDEMLCKKGLLNIKKNK